jgi:preprotein translocase subunit SecF
VVLISIGSLLTRGLNLGIDFEGGVVWDVPQGKASIEDIRKTMSDEGVSNSVVQELGSENGGKLWTVKSDALSPAKSDKITDALAKVTGSDVNKVNRNEVGPSWGEEISKKAVRALVVFLVLVTLYIAFRFEWLMAAPTLIALVHDVVITAGVYSVFGFEVTPATVIAILTILGFSIYDGIVVFDKVDENTRLVSSTGGMSYGGMVNLSLNQTLMRSINTSLTALLPVGSLLVIGSWIMGARTLQEFALALLIGLLSGAYSSIFIASPLLAVFKEREPRYRDIKRRIEARGGDVLSSTPAGAMSTTGGGAATRPAGGAGAGDGGGGVTVGPSGRVIPPRPRKKTKGSRR